MGDSLFSLIFPFTRVADTTSCGQIFLDTQGEIAYKSVLKKRFLINRLPWRLSYAKDIFSRHHRSVIVGGTSVGFTGCGVLCKE